MLDKAYSFELPSHHKSIIKVIGVGGGGSNAVNHMFNQGIKDVEFVVCNTDAQALKSSPVPNKLQIGLNLTEGLGAGANPERGKNAAIESREEIRDLLSNNTKMVFITAGMGGGTGTGAAPVIARIAKDLDILTVGIVTLPFSFEGKKKMDQAEKGIAELRESCDTVLTIMNDKLGGMFGGLTVRQAFAQADNVLTTAAKSIAEIITVTADVNVDFEDVKTVMKDSGAAVMGSSTRSGDGRATTAAQEALASPLLNNVDVHGAKKILLSIMSGDEDELRMDELREITNYIQQQAGENADMIFGQGYDSSLGNSIRVTVIATGFGQPENNNLGNPSRVVTELESNRQITIFDVNKNSELKNPPANTIPNEENNASVEKEKEETREVEFDLRNEPTTKVISKTPLNSDLEERNKKLLDAYRERVARLKGLNTSLTENDVKQKSDEPAYLRKEKKFVETPKPDESNVSRYTLSDEDGLLGNNKFLHDNVD